jgi:glycosyltransferase involved in cell wall biosynthesis
MKRNKLVLFAHLPHYFEKGRFKAYEPYVREIEIWSQLFNEIVIYTEVVKSRPNFQIKSLPENVRIKKVRMKSGPGLSSNLLRLIQFPFVFIKLFFIVRKAEIIHLRSPGVTTYMVLLLNKCFNKNIIVKWATQFSPLPVGSIILNLEYQILKEPLSNTKVLIYGKSENANHISFIPALMSENELNSMARLDISKSFAKPLRLLCVGRLYRYKEFDRAILALSNVKDLDWVLDIVGDGECLQELQTLAFELGINERIFFRGKKSFEETCEYYLNSDISIIPGRYEGWAKVINESWHFGVIPMVTSGGNTAYPLLLSNNSGIIFNSDLSDFPEKLFHLSRMKDEDLFEIRNNGIKANYDLSLENFQQRLNRILYEQFE